MTLPICHYQIVTFVSLPNCHYQIVVTKLSPYKIVITKLSLPNCHYQIDITKNPPVINVSPHFLILIFNYDLKTLILEKIPVQFHFVHCCTNPIGWNLQYEIQLKSTINLMISFIEDLV